MSGLTKKLPIAYLTMGFPIRSETAVVREIFALDQKAGFDVQVFSVRPLTFGQGIYEPKAELFKKRALGFSPKLALRGVKTSFRHLATRNPAFLRLLKETLKSGGPQLPKSLVVLVLSTALAEEAQSQGIRYIHGNFASFQAYAAYAIHHLTGIPFGFTMHAHDLFIHGFMMPEKIRDGAVVLSISEFNRQYIKDRWQLDPTNIPIVHCGIDLSEFTAKPHPRGTKGAPLKLLSVGRLTAMKGFTHLISALAELWDVPIEYDLVGSGEDELQLREKVKALGLSKRVHFHTACPQDALKKLYHGAHVYIQPSIRLKNGLMEGVPATLMEAMACGLPCISTKLSGIPEIVKDRQTGLLIPPESPKELATAIRWIYNNEEASQGMGKAGRLLVETEFDATINAKALGTLIKKALGVE